VRDPPRRIGVGRVSGDLGCGTPLGRVAGAADETLLLALRTDLEAAH
jgi:hypothetical protein